MLKNNPTSPGNDTSLFVTVSTQHNGFQRIRKTSGFPRFFKTYRIRNAYNFNELFLQVQKQTSIPMDLHNIFKSFSFQKMSDFLVVFKQYKHWISNTTYELTNISYVDVFQNTCILREPVNQRKTYSVTVAVYLCMNRTI